MSIFNFRRGRPASAKASSKASSKTAPESVEVVRKRARQRLIGSALLVLLGVVGFPLLFETQPRPVAVDIPIEIPSRNAVKPASPIQPVQRAEQSATAAGEVSAASASPAAVDAHASLHAQEEIVESKPVQAPAAAAPASEHKDASHAVAKAEAKPEAKPEVKAESKPKADDGQRAKALLEGTQTSLHPAGEARLVVQVGAFADTQKAREVRAKLEKAGLKTYTQVAETKDGKRIRVRVGPYATKAEADKAAARIKSLDLPAAVLTL